MCKENKVKNITLTFISVEKAISRSKFQLVIGEAQHLAVDFANACLTEFPAKSIAQCRLKKCSTMSVMELEKEKEKFGAAKFIFLFLRLLIKPELRDFNVNILIQAIAFWIYGYVATGQQNLTIGKKC